MADLEKHVGKLDDVCYVTNTVVHGIQIKWSTVGTPFKYSDFFGVIGGIADGWKNLGNLYPGKKVKAILLTNRPCSTRDLGMRDGNGKAIGRRMGVSAVGGGGCFELMKVKGVLYAIWQFCRYLFWLQWGSKRRRAREEDERMLEEGRTIGDG